MESVKSKKGGEGARVRGDKLMDLWKNVQNGVENSIRGFRVFVIKVIVGGGFFVHMEPFYGI